MMPKAEMQGGVSIADFEPNGLEITRIAPDCGAQYSPNLYRWLTARNNRPMAQFCRVYRDTDDCLWIGMLDGRELIGSKLIGVLCNGAAERTAAWQHVDAIEVPDFWSRYIEDGRCAIDVDHSMGFINDQSRWRMSGDRRECNWCGKVSQTLKRWTDSVQRKQWA